MPRRQDDDWHRRGLSHLGDQFDAALVREAEVEDHQIRLFGRQRPHRAHGVFRFQDSVAGSGKAGTQEAADRWLVVDDKDGVFCRTAPSTSAIMRSRKVEPCAAVIRTLSQSDVTRVPPVTAERSPPLSRMTGADSPVMADSSTEATPSMTSPSLGIRSPASTRTRSPALRAVASISSKLGELAA